MGKIRRCHPYQILSPDELVEGQEYEKVYENHSWIRRFKLLQKHTNKSVSSDTTWHDPKWMLAKDTGDGWRPDNFDSWSYADAGLLPYGNGSWHDDHYVRIISQSLKGNTDIYRNGVEKLFS